MIAATLLISVVAANFYTTSKAATLSPSGIAIIGTVNYGNVVGTPTPKFVSNVQIDASGFPNLGTTTAFPSGSYLLLGFGPGSYTVTPSKTGGVNGSINSFDAALISLHVAGPPNAQLNATQLIAADVSGNGTVSSLDAAMIAKYAAGPPYSSPGIGLTTSWKFTPPNRSYTSILTIFTNQDYAGFLLGEVSGNWTNTGARSSSQTNVGPAIAVEAPRLVTKRGDEIVIPVSVQGIADRGIISYEFDLRYDPSVILPQKAAADLTGTVSRGLSVVTNTATPGMLRVVVYGPTPISNSGVLLNLKFTAVGTAGSTTSLTWERIMLNEGSPLVTTTDGGIEVF